MRINVEASLKALTLPLNATVQMRTVLPWPARKTGWKHRRHLSTILRMERWRQVLPAGCIRQERDAMSTGIIGCLRGV